MEQDTKIRPALSADDWQAALDPERAYPGPATQRRHERAALALYRQPFGFTHEDVALLRREATQIERAARWCPPGYSYSIHDVIEGRGAIAERAKPLRDLADRIEALLPPE